MDFHDYKNMRIIDDKLYSEIDRELEENSKENNFYNKRTAGEELRLLSEVTGNKHYKNNEKCKVDNFLSPYIGKYIDGKNWEIFTTGLEHIIFNR